jgi:AcrR family transcriptional regulator
MVRLVLYICGQNLHGLRTEERHREDKAETIVTTAQKWFGLYGVEKTSMREIANDLRISKAALYYYFPDKESLYKSVISKEQSEFLRILEKDILNIPDPAVSLRKYALTRLSYFRKLMNLSRIRLTSLSSLKPLIANSVKRFRDEEMKIVIRILENGIQANKFNIDNVSKVATLYLDLLRGLRSAFISEKDLLVIEDSEFRALSDKVNDITEIFIKGLMYK